MWIDPKILGGRNYLERVFLFFFHLQFSGPSRVKSRVCYVKVKVVFFCPLCIGIMPTDVPSVCLYVCLASYEGRVGRGGRRGRGVAIV